MNPAPGIRLVREDIRGRHLPRTDLLDAKDNRLRAIQHDGFAARIDRRWFCLDHDPVPRVHHVLAADDTRTTWMLDGYILDVRPHRIHAQEVAQPKNLIKPSVRLKHFRPWVRGHARLPSTPSALLDD